jgi:hypothetical protein
MKGFYVRVLLAVWRSVDYSLRCRNIDPRTGVRFLDRATLEPCRG